MCGREDDVDVDHDLLVHLVHAASGCAWAVGVAPIAATIASPTAVRSPYFRTLCSRVEREMPRRWAAWRLLPPVWRSTRAM